MSENITWGKRKRFADGQYSIPYSRFLGYDYGMSVNLQEANLVRKIYYLYLLGLSGYQIANLLTEQKIPTPGGKDRWNPGCVRSILSNEKYKGDALLQKEFTIDYISKKKKKNEGELPMYYVTGGHQAIIPPPLHEYIQEGNARRIGFKGNRYSGIHPFLGKILCDNCGMTYRRSVWHSTSYGDIVWECSSRYKGHKCGATHFYDIQFQKLLRLALRNTISNRPNTICALKQSIRELPTMTNDRLQNCINAIDAFSEREPEQIQLTQSDAILSIKTIHISSERTMKFTFLDDSIAEVYIPPFSPRR